MSVGMFFPIYTGVFFTLYTISISHEFNILNTRVSHIQKNNELLKEELKLLNEKLIDRNI
jgi:hypothetical protein